MNIVLSILENILKIKMNRRHVKLIDKGCFLNIKLFINTFISNSYLECIVSNTIPKGNHNLTWVGVFILFDC